MQLNGKKILIKGSVLAMLADTLAAHSIGGFKVGFALRICRNCLATKSTAADNVSHTHEHINVLLCHQN